MEQFNPCLRNFVAMGKNYEKALASKSFFSDLFSLCFSLQVQALGQGLCLSLSLQIELPVGHFVLQKEGYSSFH